MQLNRVTTVPDRVPIRNALVSLADKRGLDTLIEGLRRYAPECTIYSTGGTYTAIETLIDRSGPVLRRVTEYTGQPEMQGGLVKTLDFRIYLGLLSERYNAAHQEDLERTGSVEFDLVLGNLYPFEQAAAEADSTLEDLRTHIDIGGPTMLRAAAKNFLRVASVCHPEDYPEFIDHLRENRGATTLPFSADLAARVFRYTAHYEAAIAGSIGRAVHGVSLGTLYEITEDAP